MTPRILILSQYFWPESFQINALVDALGDAGADVTVLTGQPNYPDGKVFPGYHALSVRRERYGKATDVFRVPIAPRGRASGVRLALNYLSFIASASLIGPWLLRRRPVDVVFVFAPSPILQSIAGVALKTFKGAKLVTWVQDLWPQSLMSTGHVTNPSLLSAVEELVRWIYRHNDRLYGQSQAFVAEIGKLAERTPVEYFPNPGDSAFAAGGSSQLAKLTLPAGFNVVFAGNLGTVQALDTVLDAATLLRDEADVRFVLIGSGSRGAWLAEEVARLGLANVMLPGRFEMSAMPAILSQADALLASMKRSPILSQTIPSKVQAYLAAGKPILASMDGEGAELVVQAGAGLASPAEDAAALATNVRRLRTMAPSERAGLGANGLSFYDRHFHPRRLAEQLIKRFNELTTSTNKSQMTFKAVAL